MKKTTINITLLVIGLILNFQNSYSQHGGNGRNYYAKGYASTNSGLQSVQSTDSTITITSKILLNKQADFYFISLGVSQESKTVKEGFNLINKRIKELTNKLSSLGILKKDYYIDYISHTRVYDYKLINQFQTQFEAGFEIKKNIIIKLVNIDKFDELIELAANQNIHDIIKVDYRNNDMDKIHKKLYQQSIKIIEDKKNLYLNSSNRKVHKKNKVAYNHLTSVPPNSRYNSYTAASTSEIYHYNNSSYVRKNLRKKTTSFYNGVPISGFDKIINNASPVVGIQYIMTVTIVYEYIK